MAWEDILKDPEFQSLGAPEKEQVLRGYFSEHVDADPEFQAHVAKNPGARAEVWSGMYATIASPPGAERGGRAASAEQGILERSSRAIPFSGVEGAYSGEMPATSPRHIVEGSLRAGAELPLFPARAVGEMAAASAGRPAALEGVPGEIASGKTDEALRTVVGEKFQGTLDMAKAMFIGEAIGAATSPGGRPAAFEGYPGEDIVGTADQGRNLGEVDPGSIAFEEGLSMPFVAIGYVPQKIGQHVLEKTGDPLLAKAAEYGSLLGMFRVAHRAGKAYEARDQIISGIEARLEKARQFAASLRKPFAERDPAGQTDAALEAGKAEAIRRGVIPSPEERAAAEVGAETVVTPPEAVVEVGGATERGGTGTGLPAPGEVKPELHEVGAEPVSPPGERWIGDRGAIPGEPSFFLDGDAETAKAAIIERPTESGGATWLAVDREGNAIAETTGLEQARKAAEAYVDRQAMPIERRQAPYEGPRERRKNLELRKKVAEMSPEERAEALMYDSLTGLKSRRAFDEEIDQRPVKVAIDAHGLKWINDNIGHEAGDQLLRAVADAIHRSNEDGYRISGDEMAIQADSPDAAARAVERIKRELSQGSLAITLPDGSTKTFRGITVSHGIGGSIDEAFAALNADKQAAIGRGERSAERGGRPGKLLEVPSPRDESPNRPGERVRDTRKVAPEGVGGEPVAGPGPRVPPLRADERVETLLDRIRHHGRIRISKEEWRALNVMENGLAPFFTTKGRDAKGRETGGWDVLLPELVETGFLRREASSLDDLVDAITRDQVARAKGGQRISVEGVTDAEVEEMAAKWEEKYRPESVPVSSLKTGDTFRMHGEKFEVVEDRDEGVLIRDGRQEWLDHDGTVLADHGDVKRAEQPPAKPTIEQLADQRAAEEARKRGESAKLPGVEARFRLTAEEGAGGEYKPAPPTEQDLLPGTEKAYRDVGMREGGGEASSRFAPEEGFRRKPEGEGEGASEPVRRSDIVNFLREKFDIPIRTGRFRNALGIFKVKPEVIRSKFANDIETISHEVGHALQKFLWPGARTPRGNLSGRVFEKYADELEPIATKPRSGQSKLPEGFAEFVRLYVTNPERAKQAAPNFFSHFEATLAEKSPEAREVLLSVRRDYERWLKQPAVARVLGQISIGKKEKTARTFTDLYAAAVDDIYPLEKRVKEVAAGEKLPADLDPSTLARLYAGVGGKVETFLFRGTYNFRTYRITGKPLQAIFDEITSKGDPDNFRAYAVARRALEKHGQGIETGILSEDAQAVVARFDSAYKDAFEETRKYQDAALKLLLDSGVIGRFQYIAMRRANRDYVPFYRVFEGEAGGKGGAKGFEVKGSPAKRMKGSWRDIVDPLESIIKNTYLFVEAAEKNAVGRALVDLANKKEGMGKYVEKIPADLMRTGLSDVELNDILRRFGKWKETSRFSETSQTIRESIKDAGTGADIPAGDRGTRIMEDRAREALTSRGWSPAEADQILRRIKGAGSEQVRDKLIEKTIEKTVVLSTVKEFGIELPEGFVDIFRPSKRAPKGNVITVMERGKPVFYEVHPDIYRAFSALDKESAGFLLRALGAPARLLRAGVTLSPEFGARNLVRDMFTAFIHTPGSVPIFDTVRGLASALKKDDWYWKWKQGGGEHAMVVSLDREYLQKDVAELLRKKTTPEIAKTIVRHPIEALRVLSEFSESATRIGVFRRTMEGKEGTKADIQAAAYASREGTVDFARKGAQTKAVRMLVAFWGPGVQGLDRMGRAFKNAPLPTTAKAMAAITIPSIILAIANHDDPRYKEIPQWQKDLFWIVLTKDRIWRIPKPFEYGLIFGTVPERVVGRILDDDPHAFDGMLKTMGQGLSPGYVPTVMNPLIEGWANRSMFTDHPLVPKNREDVLPPYRYQPYTTETAKRVGRLIGKLPVVGDTGAAAPANIENLIQGWTGGLGMLALQAADKALKTAGIAPKRIDPSPTLADVPLIKGFVVRYPSSDAESIRRFYDSYSEASQLLATARQVEREGKGTEALQLVQSGNLARLEEVKAALGNGHRFIEAVYANPDITPEEKRRLIDETYLSMIAIAAAGNTVLEGFNRASQPKRGKARE